MQQQSLPRFNVSNRFKREEERKPLAVSTPKFNGKSNEEIKLGFANLPEQMQRKAVKKGFNFTLMVVGESGLGKSTFVNSLLNQSIYEESRNMASKEMLESTTKIEKHFIELDEKGVKLRLTIVDTPGFGDAVDCRECWRPIEEYIDDTFYHYFRDECAINRKNIVDNRVHCCLYFISPSGRGLKPIDVEFMRTLHNKVNIVPIIAKADSLTENELKSFKLKVLSNLEKFQINFYQPPICGSDEEEELKAQDVEIRESIPFAIIGSNIVVESETGRKFRGRQYPWGIVDVENMKHCNFNILRSFVLRTHMQDLKDVTNDILYENYRGDFIQQRMTRRNNDRYATINSKTESNASSIDDIVDTNSLLQEKDDEIQKIQATISKIQTHVSNDSNNDTGSLASRSTNSALNLSINHPSVATTASDSPAPSIKSSSTVSSAK